MDFFGHQQRARTATRWLVMLFAAAVLGIIACIYFAAVAALGLRGDGRGLWQPEVLAAVSATTLLIVGIAMAWKTAQLRSGGSSVAAMLGGRLVPPATADLGEQRLRNVVEEMAIASGVPVPAIYVLDDEQGLNAFAAGWSPADAAIAVTRGCLEQLDRDELQGVVAHEFSHVFHGDMRLNIRLVGVLFGIVCITTIGRILVRVVGRGGGGRGKGGAAGIAVFGILLILIGWLGVLFARLIQAAVSRHREYLADASAVQYTRNPHGIGMALAKIGGHGGRLQNAHADEASHMLFADGVQRFLGGAFATHPPIAARVERILPGFERRLAAGTPMTAAVAATPAPPGAFGLSSLSGPAAPAAPIAAGELLRTVGAPEAQNVAAARELLRDLPLELLAAAHEPARAPALVLGLLLDADAARREAQCRPLLARDAALAHDAQMLFRALTQIAPSARLALLELAIPALRSLPPQRRQQVRSDARTIAVADGTLSPFEFALCKTIERHVRLPAEPPARRGRQQALAEHGKDTIAVLSVLARAGAGGDEAAAARAFAAGLHGLAIDPAAQLLPASACTLAALEPAVDALAAVSPFGKRNLLAACAAAAGADGMLAPDEAALLRALAESWDCPVPLAAPATPAAGIRG